VPDFWTAAGTSQYLQRLYMVGVCFYGKATAIERDPVGGFRTILWEKLEEEMAYIVVTLIFF
jgi:hypothetical protein